MLGTDRVRRLDLPTANNVLILGPALGILHQFAKEGCGEFGREGRRRNGNTWQVLGEKLWRGQQKRRKRGCRLQRCRRGRSGHQPVEGRRDSHRRSRRRSTLAGRERPPTSLRWRRLALEPAGDRCRVPCPLTWHKAAAGRALCSWGDMSCSTSLAAATSLEGLRSPLD